MLNHLRIVLATATGAVLMACVPGTAGAASAAAPTVKSGFWAVASGGIASLSPEASPNCGKGVCPRKVVATYKAKRVGKGGYRTDTLYCGNSAYGYRHLQKHIGEYFGGWGNFSFSIAQTLQAPAHVLVQSNGNYRESAPIYQCFYAGYYYIWTFYVVPVIKSGSIVTAYGSKGKKVDQPCP